MKIWEEHGGGVIRRGSLYYTSRGSLRQLEQCDVDNESVQGGP